MIDLERLNHSYRNHLPLRNDLYLMVYHLSTRLSEVEDDLKPIKSVVNVVQVVKELPATLKFFWVRGLNLQSAIKILKTW